MRTGGVAVPQVLAAEAADVVRQAVSLARGRGHAQVTPLHVASAMLSAAGLLRAACLQSHPHRPQCKTLELCFNVALNRLPTAVAAAMFHHVGHDAPVLSNALIAAFKRANALQRRGSSAEGLQHPAALVVKVDLEQLIISILDDPSVSRVMSEAGLSSSLVKANVEKAVSNTTSSVCTPPKHCHNNPMETKAKTDDAIRVLDCMASGRTWCVVVVGESAASAECVVKSAMDRVSKGELLRQHECLKNLQFVPLSIASFQRMRREEVQAKASDLRALVREGCAAGKGVVLILEDLNYAAEAWAAVSEKRKVSRAHGHYCPVEHGVMEVSSLVRSGRGDVRLYLLGFGTYPSYTNCRTGQPSLAAVWELHPIVVPDGDVALSLGCDSSCRARSRTEWPGFVGAAAGDSDMVTATTASLPAWLCRYRDPVLTRSASCDTSPQLQDLCNTRWNSTRNGSSHRRSNCGSVLTLSFSSSATASLAASSISGFTNDCFTSMSFKSWPLSSEPGQPWPNHRQDDPMGQPYDRRSHANPNPDYSTSVCNPSDGTAEAAACHRPKFTELTAENLKIICSALEMGVPRHKDIVLDIASTVLRCRSGMMRRMVRRERRSSATWLIFQGMDSGGKKAMAQALARLVFGSYMDFTSITITEFTPVNFDSSSNGELTLKRKRSPGNTEHCYVQWFYEAIRDNPHRVMMIDSAEKLDYDSKIGIKNAIAEGRIRGCNGDVINLEDAIVVLTSEVYDSRSRASSPRVNKRVIIEDGEEYDGIEKEVKSHSNLDLNAYAEDGEEKQESSLNDVEILNVVDGVFFF